MLDRNDYWQVAFVIAKGTGDEIRARGLDAVPRARSSASRPELADRVGRHHRLGRGEAADGPRRSPDDNGTSPDISRSATPRTRCRRSADSASTSRFRMRSRRPTCSGGRSRDGRVSDADLAEVQRRRERPVRVLQGFQTLRAEPVSEAGADVGSRRRPFRWIVRLMLRIPVLRDIPPRLIALGIDRPHIESPRHTADA